MGIYSIKPAFQKSLQPAARFCIARKIHPDYINLAGLVISLLMAGTLFFASRIPSLLWILPVGAFARTACNALDGMVARGLSVSSRMGEVYNEFLDRISDMAIFASIGFSDLGRRDLALTTCILILLNSYLGILGKASGGRRIYAGLIGKADRMILVGLAGMVAFFHMNEFVWNALLLVVLAGSVIAMLQRLIIIRKELGS